MATASTLGQGNLRPFRVENPFERRDQYALLGTGLNGMLVTYVTGNQSPDNADGYSTQAVGASYTNTYAPLYFNNRRVRPAAAGDTKYEIAGVTLYTTALTEENGLPINLMPQQTREARGFVATGNSVPFAQRGKYTFALDRINKAPLAGYPVVATGVGAFAQLTPTEATTALNPVGQTGWNAWIVGSVASASGANNGGYFELELKGA
jgi:hypothetical protein